MVSRLFANQRQITTAIFSLSFLVCCCYCCRSSIVTRHFTTEKADGERGSEGRKDISLLHQLPPRLLLPPWLVASVVVAAAVKGRRAEGKRREDEKRGGKEGQRVRLVSLNKNTEKNSLSVTDSPRRASPACVHSLSRVCHRSAALGPYPRATSLSLSLCPPVLSVSFPLLITSPPPTRELASLSLSAGSSL